MVNPLKIESWVWDHFTKVNRDLGICKICHLEVRRSGGTTAIERHLIKHHRMPNPRTFLRPSVSLGSKPENTNDKSTEKTSSNSIKNYMKNSQLNKSLSFEIKEEAVEDEDLIYIHEDSDDHNDKTISTNQNENPADSLWIHKENVAGPAITAVKVDNCFVCNEVLTTCCNKLSLLLKFTEVPLYNILESFTGISIDENSRLKALVCHSCLFSFQKYDDLQQQTNDIQQQMTLLYKRTRDEADSFNEFDESETAYYAEDPEIDDSPDNESNEAENATWNAMETEDIDYEPKIEDVDCDSNESLVNELPDHPKSKGPNSRSKFHPFCMQCYRTFDVARYEMHLITNHEKGKGPFKCGRCSKLSDDVDAFKLHYLKHSLQESKIIIMKERAANGGRYANKKHVCTIPGCTKRFANPFKLSSHLKVHFGIKTFECPICNRKFTERFELNSHIRLKHPEKADEVIEPKRPAATKTTSSITIQKPPASWLYKELTK